jgi:hypothetical protein
MEIKICYKARVRKRSSQSSLYICHDRHPIVIFASTHAMDSHGDRHQINTTEVGMDAISPYTIPNIQHETVLGM